jgi:hypothetical protein
MNRPEFHGPNLENHPHYDPAPVPGASAWAIGVIGLGGGGSQAERPIRSLTFRNSCNRKFRSRSGVNSVCADDHPMRNRAMLRSPPAAPISAPHVLMFSLSPRTFHTECDRLHVLEMDRNSQYIGSLADH